MTSAFDIALKVAKEVMDVIEGTSTSGSTTTLADNVLLADLPNDFFNGGRLYIKSGTNNSGSVFAVTDFTTSTGVVTFATITNAIVAGQRYAIVRNSYPFDQILSAIQRALDDTWVTAIDATLTGDGETLDFSLPTGVFFVTEVELTDTSSTPPEIHIAHHWREKHNGKLRFDFGYAPDDDFTITVYYRTPHAEIATGSTTINNEIDIEWLKYRAAQELLWWGVSMYGSQVEYRIEERMTKVMEALKKLSPHRRLTTIIHNAGG